MTLILIFFALQFKRFIPNRSVNNFETSHHLMTSSPSSSTRSPNGNADNYSTRRLYLEAYDTQAQNKVLSLSCKPMSRSDKEKLYERELSLKYHTVFNSRTRRNATRTLPEVPELMLDVPALRDDFCRSFYFFKNFLIPNLTEKHQNINN